MKNLSNRRRQGFTLVELLIVISIIMVLAALGFAGIQTALKNAKKTETLNIATNLQQAINNFYDEYGSLPTTNATNEPLTTTTGEGLNVLRVLLAQEPTGTGTTTLNTRGIRFLDVKQAKAKKGGIDYSNGTTVTGIYDSWGQPLYIVFDEDYNDEIPNPNAKGPSDNMIIRGAKAVVYSAGADRTLGKGDLKTGKDDIRTW